MEENRDSSSSQFMVEAQWQSSQLPAQKMVIKMGKEKRTKQEEIIALIITQIYAAFVRGEYSPRIPCMQTWGRTEWGGVLRVVPQVLEHPCALRSL